MSSSSRRPTHRKRISALRLSSDTTSTLPEYIQPSGWQQHYQQIDSSRLGEDPEPSDKPPDYPDSAEEADEDTDTDSNVVYVPQHLPPAATLSPRPHTASPRRAKRFLPAHKRRISAHPTSAAAVEPSDPYLDALLERSVHALEMSNTLLQSSISTQSSLSAILASDSRGDSTLEARAMNLSSRIKDTWDAKAAWADDLEEITRNVEGLFGGAEEGSSSARRHQHQQDYFHHGQELSSSPRSSLLLEGSSGISSSLPSSSPLYNSMGSRRRPSLDLRQASDSSMPRLTLTPQNRVNLIAPAPRALTQYVASTQDTEAILLPSTIGLRALPSVYNTSEWKSLYDLASSSTTSLLSAPAGLSAHSLPPKLTDKPLEPSTPAYNMLSSFVYRQPSSGSATPSTSFTTSFMSNIRRNSREDSNERSGGSGRRRSSSSPVSHKSADRLHRQGRSSPRSGSSSATSTSRTPKRGVSPLDSSVRRPMTPPVEESSSSSSSDGCVAKRTVLSLRKILDDQPAPQPPESSLKHLKPPQFLPRTPAPVASAGTSTATASISRLFTKGTHSSSTRAPSPPRLSAMKHSRTNSIAGSSHSAPPTPSSLHLSPSPSPTTLSIPDIVSKVLGGRGSSASSSGLSTPNKRISFAELPESYASTRPGGAGSSKFKDMKHNKRKRKGRGRDSFVLDGSGGGHSRNGSGSSALDGGLGGWWNGWMTTTGAASGSGPGGLSLSLARQQERMEDRISRNFGGRMGAGFGTGLDEWAV